MPDAGRNEREAIMEPILSICIAAYNQTGLVEKAVGELVKCKRQELEILVSDDCSTDDIKGLVKRYDDRRIVYTRTDSNEGHDLNIVHAIKTAKGKYVMIMRSRDLVTAQNAEQIMDRLSRLEAAYCLFSSVDEEGRLKTVLSDRRYKAGRDAVLACTKLMVHPSGQIYNRKLVDIQKVEMHVRDSFDDKYGFVVHSLIRFMLAEKGDFCTFSQIGWVYADTLKAKDVAQNSSDIGISVYAPFYEYKRYRCQMAFVRRYISENFKLGLYKYLIQTYYRAVVIDFRYENYSVEGQNHYAFSPIAYSSREEWNEFKKTSGELFREDGGRYYLLCSYLLCVRMSGIKYMLKGYAVRRFIKCYWFKELHKRIKGI